MNLSFSTDKLQVLLGAAVSTVAMDVCVFYYDIPPQQKEGNEEYLRGIEDIVTNGVTPVDVLSSPKAGTTRVVTYFAVYNADSATKDVIVRLNRNGTNRILKKAIALAVGATLSWTPGSDWQVL